jgi:hypothetical protein
LKWGWLKAGWFCAAGSPFSPRSGGRHGGQMWHRLPVTTVHTYHREGTEVTEETPCVATGEAANTAYRDFRDYTVSGAPARTMRPFSRVRTTGWGMTLGYALLCARNGQRIRSRHLLAARRRGSVGEMLHSSCRLPQTVAPGCSAGGEQPGSVQRSPPLGVMKIGLPINGLQVQPNPVT